MKKSIFLILFLFSLACYSQISLDFQTPMLLNYVRLNNSQTKYIDERSIQQQQLSQFSLYNLDGSLFKTIQIPPKPNPSAGVQDIYWISTSLFDNDSTTIEYLIVYYWDSIPGYAFQKNDARIIREDGTILLDEMNAISNNGAPPLIYNTEEGTKLLLQYRYADFTIYQTKIFSLPGNLPVCVNNAIVHLNGDILLYPNPNSGSFSIKLNSKDGDLSIIDLYGLDGRLIETYKSSGKQSQITNYGLSDGLYFINARSKYLNSTTKMIIKK